MYEFPTICLFAYKLINIWVVSIFWQPAWPLGEASSHWQGFLPLGATHLPLPSLCSTFNESPLMACRKCQEAAPQCCDPWNVAGGHGAEVFPDLGLCWRVLGRWQRLFQMALSFLLSSWQLWGVDWCGHLGQSESLRCEVCRTPQWPDPRCCFSQELSPRS